MVQPIPNVAVVLYSIDFSLFMSAAAAPVGGTRLTYGNHGTETAVKKKKMRTHHHLWQ